METALPTTHAQRDADERAARTANVAPADTLTPAERVAFGRVLQQRVVRRSGMSLERESAGNPHIGEIRPNGVARGVDPAELSGRPGRCRHVELPDAVGQIPRERRNLRPER